MTIERFTVIVEARSDVWDAPPAVRLRRWLKAGKRVYGLVCTEATEAAPADAWYGWRLCGAEWVRVCCAASESLCRALLAERSGRCVAKPKGEFPTKALK